MALSTSGTLSWSRPAEALALFCRGRTARTAGPTAAIVGTLLSAVNQGQVVLAGEGDTGTWIRVAVNYLVPYTVASIGFLSARRVDAAVPNGRYCVELGRAGSGPTGILRGTGRESGWWSGRVGRPNR
jgi:hypothetical protein